MATARQRKDGSFDFVVYVSQKYSETGKAHQLVRPTHDKPGYKTKEEAILAGEKYSEEIKNPNNEYKKERPFSRLFDEWVKIYHADNAPATLKNYDFTSKQIKEYYTDKSLENINADVAQNFTNTMVSKKYGKETISKILGHINSFFRRQMKNKIVDDNPFDDITFKASHAHEKENKYKFFGPTQLKKILPVLRDLDLNQDVTKVACLVALGTGSRPEELLALKWNKLNIPNQKVTFDHVYQSKTKTYTENMKNENSKRTIHIDSITLSYLKKLKTYQNKNNYYDADGFIFITPKTKKIMSYDNLNQRLKTYLRQAGLSGKYTMYAWRHTHASLILSNENGILTQSLLLAASKRLGHANPTQTMDTYWHLFPQDNNSADKNLDSKIDKLFKNSLELSNS